MVSGFVRNEFILKNYWVSHYNSIGLEFKTETVNGLFWLIWSFVLAYVIIRLAQKFSFAETLLS